MSYEIGIVSYLGNFALWLKVFMLAFKRGITQYKMNSKIHTNN